MFGNEDHKIYYSHPALTCSCFVTRIQFAGNFEVEDIKKTTPRKCRITGWFDNGNNTYVPFNYKEQTIKPSVRAELEKAVKDYLFYCGLDMKKIVRESHSVEVSYRNGEIQYEVAYEGVPGSNKVVYLVYVNRALLTQEYKDIDIKNRNALMRHADDVCRRHLVNSVKS